VWTHEMGGIICGETERRGEEKRRGEARRGEATLTLLSDAGRPRSQRGGPQLAQVFFLLRCVRLLLRGQPKNFAWRRGSATARQARSARSSSCTSLCLSVATTTSSSVPSVLTSPPRHRASLAEQRVGSGSTR
jgi:hypothetical protein